MSLYLKNYASNYVTVYLVFVIYAHFNKKCSIYSSTFYFKFGQNASISMQTKKK